MPLLVLANKQDMAGVLTAEQVSLHSDTPDRDIECQCKLNIDIHVLPQVQSGLMLDIAMGRAWSVVETSARTGDGVLRGLSWLTSNM